MHASEYRCVITFLVLYDMARTQKDKDPIILLISWLLMVSAAMVLTESFRIVPTWRLEGFIHLYIHRPLLYNPSMSEHF